MDTIRVSASVEPISVQSALRARINQELIANMRSVMRVPGEHYAKALRDSYADVRRGWTAEAYQGEGGFWYVRIECMNEDWIAPYSIDHADGIQVK